MQVVHGVEQLAREHGPGFVVVGVFDGLHLGHAYLLRHLVEEARARDALPTVITFDHHPDEVLTGKAPPLLIDPAERLDRLAAAGVAVTVVQHFDQALRETPYDLFVDRFRERIDLRGFLMTPDAAFGFERRGTPEALRELGTLRGFEVVVIAPFTLDGRPVRSSEIRSAIAAGDLAGASALLGRAVTLTGIVEDAGPDGVGLGFELPVALPPAGEYPCRVNGQPGRLRIDREVAYLRADVPLGAMVTVELTTRDATAAPGHLVRGSRSGPSRTGRPTGG
jgi:riboflavin kinase/FMN adenylyltransferase